MKKKSYMLDVSTCVYLNYYPPLSFFSFWKGNEKDEEENIINLTTLFSTKCPVSLLNFSFKKKTRTNEKSFDDFSFYGQSNNQKNNVNRTKLK
jgi:hypothetical protein